MTENEDGHRAFIIFRSKVHGVDLFFIRITFSLFLFKFVFTRFKRAAILQSLRSAAAVRPSKVGKYQFSFETGYFPFILFFQN